MRHSKLTGFFLSGILAALLAGCFNPITAVPPKSEDPLTEQEEAGGTGIPDTGSFVVTIPVNPVSGGRAATGDPAGLKLPNTIKNGGVINSLLLVVLDEEGDVVDSREDIKTADTDDLAEVSVALSPGEYDFLLLMGHRERNYAQEESGGPYLYKAGPPTLLAAGFLDNKEIAQGMTSIDITMFTLAVVETKFTSTTLDKAVTAQAEGVDLDAAGDWELTWKVNENGLKQLKDARTPRDRDRSYLFRDIRGKAWETAGAFTSFSNIARFDYDAGAITLDLGGPPGGIPCAAWFNLEYAPFSLDEWDGPVWVIRNGVNDLPQDDKTDFTLDSGTTKIQWSSEKNGNGAVRFKLKTPGIKDTDLTPYIPAPVTGGMPAAAVVGKEYIGSVAWSVTGGAPHSGLFQANTSYTATATLYPLQGYSFEGVAANFFEHDEKDDKAASSPNPAYDANSGVVTIVFPKTNPLPTVNDLDLTLKVPAPVIGADPVTYFAAPQYTGQVVWSGTPAAFAGETGYTATVTLTAAPGWSFEGVKENSFRHDGKDKTVSGSNPVNDANSGVVTIVFPATDPAPVEVPVKVDPDSTSWGE